MKIGILDCTNEKFLKRRGARRDSSAYSLGVQCIEHDLIASGIPDRSYVVDRPFPKFQKRGFPINYNGKRLPVIDIDRIRDVDIVLLPLTSVQEIESFLMVAKQNENLLRNSKAKIIAGGFGVVNISCLINYIDVAVFGRCDNQQICRIVSDNEKSENVWYKTDDPKFEKEYCMGKHVPPKHDYIETGNIGCHRKCYYCQYSWVRESKGKYSPQANARETDIWNSDFSKNGVYITALDGLSEETRFRVNKKITNRFLVEKLSEPYKINDPKTVGIKLYNIIGYPWETIESIKRDYEQLFAMLSKMDKKTGRLKVKIELQNTPFTPELLTPMESCTVDPTQNFGFIKSYLYKGVDYTITVSKFLQSAQTRMKRMLVNRCGYENRHIAIEYILDKKAYDKDVEKIVNNTNPIPKFKRNYDKDLKKLF